MRHEERETEQAKEFERKMKIQGKRVRAESQRKGTMKKEQKAIHDQADTEHIKSHWHEAVHEAQRTALQAIKAWREMMKDGKVASKWSS